VADLPDLDRLALFVVDVQRGFDDAEYWGPRNNPKCEDSIAALLAVWRERSRAPAPEPSSASMSRQGRCVSWSTLKAAEPERCRWLVCSPMLSGYRCRKQASRPS